MSEPDPALTAEADQTGATIRQIVDEILRQTALLGMAGQLVQLEEIPKDELRERVDEFLGELKQIPPTLKDAIIFELADRVIRDGGVLIQVRHPAMEDPDE